MVLEAESVVKSARIYLCGSIKKGLADNRGEFEFWTSDHERLIINSLSYPVELLNPSKTNISRQNYYVNFGCDIFLVRSAHVLIADLRTEKGIGVGAELMYAKQAKIPIIGWLPSNTHYRRDLSDVFGEDLKNWIHPFAYSLTDYIEETIEGVCNRVNSILSQQEQKFIPTKTIDDAIDNFAETYPELAYES